MALRAAWPIIFFGAECFRLWECEEDAVLQGNGKTEEKLDRISFDLAKASYNAAPGGYEREPLTSFQSDDLNLLEYDLARDRFKPHVLLILHGERVVGAYWSRGLFIDEDYRGKRLSTILILARATAVNGLPNPDRPFTCEGRAAMLKAHSWIKELAERYKPLDQ
ncbi:hypothetical protein [Bradyrhizobium sp. RT5a]|uniref:hypothetical protein n=1 Tax=Bradyrhizobium sp. RT5a TaxID=3156380 RepID=UPI00339A03CA